MNPSYFRIKLPMDQAVQRLCGFEGKTPKETILCRPTQAVSHCIDEKKQWKGSCLFVYENKGWTVFEDLSGFYAGMPAKAWQEFAQQEDFVAAGYNDAILYGELVVITGGVVEKEFLDDWEMPEDNCNNGDKFPEIQEWTDAADFVDNDDILYAEQGTVLIF